MAAYCIMHTFILFTFCVCCRVLDEFMRRTGLPAYATCYIIKEGWCNWSIGECTRPAQKVHPLFNKSNLSLWKFNIRFSVPLLIFLFHFHIPTWPCRTNVLPSATRAGKRKNIILHGTPRGRSLFSPVLLLNAEWASYYGGSQNVNAFYT